MKKKTAVFSLTPNPQSLTPSLLIRNARLLDPASKLDAPGYLGILARWIKAKAGTSDT